MYNALTGRNERVGNWAGVTVERKESLIRKAYYDGGEELVAVDLPGAYSMSPFTSEESITSSYVRNERPDVIVNIVDATNLSPVSYTHLDVYKRQVHPSPFRIIYHISTAVSALENHGFYLLKCLEQSE